MSFDVLLALVRGQGGDLTEEQLNLLGKFRDAVYQMNEVTNLTRIPVEEAEVRHFCDSMLISGLIPHGARVLDIGPGPGFPAWVLACCRPDLEVTAVESAGKMVRAMKTVELANLRVLEQRAEEDVQREEFDVVTGRALAPFAVQIEISAAWVKVGGLFIPFRTPTEEEEIGRFNAGVLGLEGQEFVMVSLPGGDVKRLFPVFKKVRPTPMEYPRQWGRIKTKPLS